MSRTTALRVAQSTTQPTAKVSAFATVLGRPDVQREMNLILADHPNVGRLTAGLAAISLLLLNEDSPEDIENNSPEWADEPVYPSAKVAAALRADAEVEALATGESFVLGLAATCLSRFLSAVVPNR